MGAILIGDVGSTKAHWAWLSKDRQVTFLTSGFNPIQHQPELLAVMFEEVRANCPGEISEIHYYGSGIVSDPVRDLIRAAGRQIPGDVLVSCESDMTGAARALSPGMPGIVCILGTGSNSCVFDGREIIQQIPSLGFPLGDEGSGADIGKACVRGYYYGTMPDHIRAIFADVLPADRSEFLGMYRTHDAPNRMLGSLAGRLSEVREDPFVRTLLQDSFRTFARLHIRPYQVDFPVHATGGVADAFREILNDVLEELALRCGNIVKTPLAGLISYHQYEHNE